MSQTKAKSLLETVVNTTTGVVINQVVLYFFAVPFGTATALTAVMIIVSSIRSYIVRRLFNRRVTSTDTPAVKV